MVRVLGAAAASLLGIAAVALGALVLGLFMVGVVLNWAPLKGPLASWASGALGRTVAIRGALDVEPSLRPRLSASNVALANAEWGSEPWMFEAQRLTVEVDPLELLRGGTALRGLSLLQPQLLLEMSEEGRGNWQFSEDPDDEGPPSIPELGSLTIHDGALAYRDPGLAGDLTATELDAHGVLAAGAPVRLAASGQLQGEPLELRLDGGSLADLNAGAEEPYPLDVTLQTGDSSLGLAGTIIRPLEPQEVDLELITESPDASVVRSVLGLAADIDIFRLNGRVRWSKESGWAVTDLDARLGDSDLRGSASYSKGGEGRLDIAARLDSDRLNLDQLQAVAEALSGAAGGKKLSAPAQQEKGEDRTAGGAHVAAFAPDRLLEALDALRMVEADVALAVGAIDSRDLPVRTAEARIALKDGTLTVEPLRVALADGQQLSAMIHVDASRDPVPVQAELTVGETAASVSGALGRPPGAGPVSVDIDFRSPNPSVLTSLLGRPSDLPATAVRGRLSRDGTTWALSDFSAEVGASELAGSLRLDEAGGRPSVAGELTSTRLDLDELQRVADEVRGLTGAAEEPAEADKAGGESGVREFIASTADSLRAVDADLQVAAEAIDSESVPVRGFAGHVRLDGGVLDAHELQIELADGTVTGAVRADASGAEIPIAIQASLGDSSLRVDGTLTESTDLDAFGLALKGEGQNLATLNPALRPFVDFSLPQSPPYAIAGTLTREDGTWAFDDFKIAAGASDILGSLRLEAGGQTPRLTGSLTSSTLDLPEVLTIAGLRSAPEEEVEEEEATEEFVEEATQADEGEDAAAERGGRVLPEVSLQLPYLREIDAEVDYRSDEVRGAGNLPVRELAVRLRLAGGSVAIEPLEVEVGGGRLTASLALDASEDPTRMDLDARLRGFQAQHLLALLGEQVEELAEGGSLNARAVLSARGNGLRDALRSASGDVAVVMAGGRLSALVIEAFGFDLGEALAVWFADRDEEKDKVGVRCVVGDFDLEGGVLQAQTLVLDTTDTKILGGGTIDLAAERLDLTLEPRAKDVSVFTAQTPIHLQGTFGDIEVNPDRESLAKRGAAAAGLGVLVPVLGAIIPFIEPGLAEDSDCRGLIEASEEAAGEGEGKGAVQAP